MGQGGFRFTAFSQLKIVSFEARFVVCGSDLPVWYGLLRFGLGRGPWAAGAGAERGGGEGLTATSLPPPGAWLGDGVGTGRLEWCKFLVSPVKFLCLFLFLVKLKKKNSFFSKSSLQMSGWKISVCVASGFLLKGSVALVGFHCDFGWREKA